MIPGFETPPKEKITNNILVGILGLILIVSSICFTAIGIFKSGKAFFTEYNLTALDLLYFTSGIMILFMIAIVNLLSDIKKQNVTIAKGVLHLLKQKVNNGPSKPTTPFGDMLKNLFSRQPGMNNDDMSGSISLYDIEDPDNPIFKGDFKNSDEMDQVRRNLMNKMLNSQRDFKGKKMTIDYTRLNQQIIKQAIGNLVLSKEMKQRLFEHKIKQAKAELKTRQLPDRTDR